MKTILQRTQTKLTKQVLHSRTTKTRHVTVVERKDTSVLNVKRRIQERKKTGHSKKPSNIFKVKLKPQEQTTNRLLKQKVFRAIVHQELVGMDSSLD
jgi:hypothetical protein